MSLKLVSFALCPFVHRSTTLLHEKGVPFQIEYIDLKNKPEWFLKLSPRGKVPILLVDETTLFESAIINEYLDESYLPRLLPETPIARARQRGWVEISGDLFFAYYKLTTEPTEDGFRSALASVKGTLARFEEAMTGPYFAGETFGLVDAAIAPALYRFTLLEARSKESFLAGFPKVQAWAARLATRPSVLKGVLPNFEELFDASLNGDTYFARALLKS